MANPANVRVRLAGVKGFDELSQALRDLSQELQDVVIQEAMGPACEPIEQAARWFARVRTGALRASISHKVLRKGSRPVAAAIIGPSRNYFIGPKAVPTSKGKLIKKLSSKARSAVEKPSKYAHLVEFGHLIRGGKGIGRVPAKPFMRPALAMAADATGEQMNKALEAGFSRALEKVIRKTAKAA